ncbi:hypothetical protein, partial [Serratia marcescens]|uniref:hypothetical protein n=1 Tax=Serratia marcescens TaxID=615 RepID=UPI001E45AEF6
LSPFNILPSFLNRIILTMSMDIHDEKNSNLCKHRRSLDDGESGFCGIYVTRAEGQRANGGTVL